MARKKGKALSSGAPQSVGRLDRPMQFAGGSSGVLDTSTLPLPETSLKRWFSDEAAVAAFSAPVKPRL